MKTPILIFSVLLLSSISFGQDEDITPKYSNEFLSIGVSAKALGMSNAVVAGSDDVTAGYWNPAGLTGLKIGCK